MPAYDVLYQREGRIATITLNRPEKLNAISFGMRREFDEVLDEAEADDAVRVVIIRGAGRSARALRGRLAYWSPRPAPGSMEYPGGLP